MRNMKRFLVQLTLLPLLFAYSCGLHAQMANVQNRLETTDDWADTSMVNTLSGAVTVTNGVTCICIPERNRQCTGVTGAGTFTSVASGQSATPNAGLSIFSVVATATTAAQTATSSGDTDFGFDQLWCQEFSGIATPFNQSGTSNVVNEAVTTTGHLTGLTVTPETSNTICYIAGSFPGDTGTVTHAGGSWTVITMESPDRYIAYLVQNGSTAAIPVGYTTANSRTSLSAYGCIAGTSSSASAIAKILQQH